MGPIGRLLSRPPSAVQCERVILANPSIWVDRVASCRYGRSDGSKAPGNDELHLPARASLAATSATLMTSVVDRAPLSTDNWFAPKVNRPWWSVSWTTVPHESTNRVISPERNVVVMKTVVAGGSWSVPLGPNARGCSPIFVKLSRRHGKSRPSPYSKDGGFFSLGLRTSSSSEPMVIQSSRHPARSRPLACAKPNAAALIPPALVPERTSMSTLVLVSSTGRHTAPGPALVPTLCHRPGPGRAGTAFGRGPAQQVQFAGDAAHPDRQAHPTGHGDRQPQFPCFTRVGSGHFPERYGLLPYRWAGND